MLKENDKLNCQNAITKLELQSTLFSSISNKSAFVGNDELQYQVLDIHAVKRKKKIQVRC